MQRNVLRALEIAASPKFIYLTHEIKLIRIEHRRSDKLVSLYMYQFKHFSMSTVFLMSAAPIQVSDIENMISHVVKLPGDWYICSYCHDNQKFSIHSFNFKSDFVALTSPMVTFKVVDDVDLDAYDLIADFYPSTYISTKLTSFSCGGGQQ